MKTIVITGASRGIGRALAEKFLNEGFFVIGTSRSGEAEYSHENLMFVPLELSQVESRKTCAATIQALDKKINILINNAGIWHPEDEAQTIDVAVLQETLDSNVIGSIDFTEQLLAHNLISEQIINISSRRGSLSFTTTCLYPNYGISKAALNMFTRILAARLAGKVIVSSVHPGYVKTDMNEGEGDITPQEAANDIFALIAKRVESGNFWYKGEIYPW